MSIKINSKDTDNNIVNITFDKDGKSFTATIGTITSYDIRENGISKLVKVNMINDDDALNTFLETYINAFDTDKNTPDPIVEG